jgi:hypothetical protein
VELLEKVFASSSASMDFSLFSKKYINITKTNQMIKLNLFFNKINQNTTECLQILQNHSGILKSEGICIMQIIKEMVNESGSPEKKNQINQWVLSNFEKMKSEFKDNKVFILLLKEESQFFANNINKIEFTKEDIKLKVEILQTGKKIKTNS